MHWTAVFFCNNFVCYRRDFTPHWTVKSQCFIFFLTLRYIVCTLQDIIFTCSPFRLPHKSFQFRHPQEMPAVMHYAATSAVHVNIYIMLLQAYRPLQQITWPFELLEKLCFYNTFCPVLQHMTTYRYRCYWLLQLHWQYTSYCSVWLHCIIFNWVT